MTIPTIEVSGDVSATDLDGCTNVNWTKNSNIIPLEIPTKNSDNNELFDFLGVTQTVDIKGTTDLDSTGATILAKLEAIVNGNQNTDVIIKIYKLDGTLFKSFTGAVASFNMDIDIPGSALTYGIKFFEGVVQS